MKDTIAAISSAVGPAARMIVRVSGEDAREVAAAVCTSLPAAREMRQTHLTFADMTVPAAACLFAAPHSYTGDDLVEFHTPGNPLLARMLLDALIAAGARHADPGEFTARAYFNGRMNLSAAEGVAAVVSAHSEQELRAARQLMAGELARRLAPSMETLTQTLAMLESGIDFSDEDISFVSRDELLARARRIDSDLNELIASSARFERLTHEPTFVLVGRPNAGKSTLLNALAGQERAVVSPVAGTTRDVLSADVTLARGVVRILDVAGLDESETTALIARRMVEHARHALETADYVVLLYDATDPSPPLAVSPNPDLLVATKSDLLATSTTSADLSVSALSGAGMDDLRARLDAIAFGAASGADLALNARHLQCIATARQALQRIADTCAAAGHEVIALELREALDALGGVLGEVAPDDVLGRIFSSFCIGK